MKVSSLKITLALLRLGTAMVSLHPARSAAAPDH